MRTNLIINYTTPNVELVTSTFRNKKSNEIPWDWVRRKNNRKAVMIAALYEDKFIVTKEYREPINGYEWGLPAGLIDDNESPEAAAIRELKEETGLDIEKIHHISPPVFNSSGITNESIYMIFCKATGQINQNLLEANEEIETHIFSREEIKKLVQDTTKKFGAKAYLLMLQFVQFGSLYNK